jgi:hypothetical protein
LQHKEDQHRNPKEQYRHEQQTAGDVSNHNFYLSDIVIQNQLDKRGIPVNEDKKLLIVREPRKGSPHTLSN